MTDGYSESAIYIPDIPLGPHTVPRIECGRCGTEHHIDATTLDEPGRCRECFGYLRRPTEAEQRKFTHFMQWNGAHLERQRMEEEAA